MFIDIFLGKPSKGFICCYLSLTQVVVITLVSGISYSIYQILQYTQIYQDIKSRLIYLSVCLAFILIMEMVIFAHIFGLFQASKKASFLSEQKRKLVLLEKRNKLYVPTGYDVVE
ncbi:Transmembrane domain-containing protein [Spironucleus salmonicida]|uniref:Transmembrane domain-containing protein n=1 Tax=Spironucleus salmonicida TaxID=348837 RepID=V6M009_9EUKA|nr:Transmembrane domain-containing protein [Spironucleus salmonicida]|eukprot:EST46449.1 Transmembrane domain-containing protein [Spironucleus salmonicida]